MKRQRESEIAMGDALEGDFRKAMRTLASAVSIVSTAHDDRRFGMTAASIVEVSEQPFRPEDGGELRPDALDVEQHCRRCWRRPLLHGKQHVALGLHRLDLLEQQFQTIEFTANLCLQMIR